MGFVGKIKRGTKWVLKEKDVGTSKGEQNGIAVTKKIFVICRLLPQPFKSFWKISGLIPQPLQIL